MRSINSSSDSRHWWLILLFAIYAATLIPALFLAGRRIRSGTDASWSPSLVLAVLGSTSFPLADNVWWLVAARALHGFAVGAASGEFTVALLAKEPAGRKHRGFCPMFCVKVGATDAALWCQQSHP